MKKLVVYYSLGESTKYVANSIAEAVGADVVRIRPRDEMKSTGFMKYVRGGRQVLKGQEPEIENEELDFSQYDVVFVGTPVWASSCAPAVKKILRIADFGDANLALFACFMASEGRVFKDMERIIAEKGLKVIGKKGFKEPIKGEVQKARKAMEWALDMTKGLEE